MLPTLIASGCSCALRVGLGMGYCSFAIVYKTRKGWFQKPS